MTRDEIKSWFNPIYCQLHFGGLNYAVPTLGWLQTTFWLFFRARYGADALNLWTFKWECRDFARAYACAAQECYARTTATPPEEDALAVGECWFIPDQALTTDTTKPMGHAICPIITDQGLQYIDPQNNTLWNMTESETARMYFLRF